MQAQQVVIREPGVMQIESFDVRSPGPGEMLIRTRTSLISPGTERAFFLALPTTNANYPLVPGYSNIAEVIALGEGVDQFKVGDRVASTAQHKSHEVVAAANCCLVPEILADEEAAFFNLIAIAMQGVHKARIELGESVMVIGAGPIGIFAMQLARLSGGLPLVAVDRDSARLSLAEKLGADYTLSSEQDVKQALISHCGLDGTSVVIEATGSPGVVVSAFQWAATKGRVILLGSARGEADGVNFYRDIHRKGLTVIGAHEITRPLHANYPGWWTQHAEHLIALELLARQRIQVQPLISHRFSVQEFSKAYEMLSAWDQSAIGMVIDWTA